MPTLAELLDAVTALAAMALAVVTMLIFASFVVPLPAAV